jgi:hypothetical protein
MVTFVSQQKPTTRRVQPTLFPGAMGLTECHEGQTRLFAIVYGTFPAPKLP